MEVWVSVLVEAAGLLSAVAVLGVAVRAWTARPLSVGARGGVVGREGRGSVYREADGLVFVRGPHRFRMPRQPGRTQAARRLVRISQTRVQELTAYVFRGSDHLVHAVAFTDPPARTARLIRSPRAPDRLRTLAVVPSWVGVCAVVVALCLPVVAVWVAGTTVDGRVWSVDGRGDGQHRCGISWTARDGSLRSAQQTCGDGTSIGDVVSARELPPPFEESLGDLGATLLAAMAAAAGLVLTGRAVIRARRAVATPAVVLNPVPGRVSGFDGSMPNDERWRAEHIPLFDLAVAVERVEGHADLEDNDLFRSTFRALWRQNQVRLVTAAGFAPTAGAMAAATSRSAAIGLAAGVLVLGAGLGATRLPGRGRFWSLWRPPEYEGWQAWDHAVAWRRLDGTVFVVLFDTGGGAVWSIPVDRVFASGATVEIGGRPADGALVGVRANGVELLSVGPVERVSEATAIVMRRDLVRALLGPPRPVPAASC